MLPPKKQSKKTQPQKTQPRKRELPDMVKMTNPLEPPELLVTEPIEQLELVGDNMQYSIENMKEIILLVLPHIRSLSALLAKIASKVSTLSEEFERIVRQFDIRYPVDVVKLFTNDDFLKEIFNNEEAKEMLIGKLNKKLPVQIDINKVQAPQSYPADTAPPSYPADTAPPSYPADTAPPSYPADTTVKKQGGGRRRRRKRKNSVKKNNPK